MWRMSGRRAGGQVSQGESVSGTGSGSDQDPALPEPDPDPTRILRYQLHYPGMPNPGNRKIRLAMGGSLNAAPVIIIIELMIIV